MLVVRGARFLHAPRRPGALRRELLAPDVREIDGGLVAIDFASGRLGAARRRNSRQAIGSRSSLVRSRTRAIGVVSGGRGRTAGRV